jgi:hypothetical protein
MPASIRHDAPTDHQPTDCTKNARKRAATTANHQPNARPGTYPTDAPVHRNANTPNPTISTRTTTCGDADTRPHTTPNCTTSPHNSRQFTEPYPQISLQVNHRRLHRVTIHRSPFMTTNLSTGLSTTYPQGYPQAPQHPTPPSSTYPQVIHKQNPRSHPYTPTYPQGENSWSGGVETVITTVCRPLPLCHAE